jgi:hypothetical protein
VGGGWPALGFRKQFNRRCSFRPIADHRPSDAPPASALVSVISGELFNPTPGNFHLSSFIFTHFVLRESTGLVDLTNLVLISFWANPLHFVCPIGSVGDQRLVQQLWIDTLDVPFRFPSPWVNLELMLNAPEFREVTCPLTFPLGTSNTERIL